MTNLHRHAPLRVALVGLGTVGGGVIRLLQTNADLIARRAGCPIQIVAISARDRNKDRGVDLSPFEWVDDMTTLPGREDIDVVVELIGGADGPALTLARQCLSAGKPFVTANKAMLAHHGLDLAALAEKAGIALKYEAAVAGGIPVIKGMREGAAANEISRVYGILNGTCNYILTTMEKEGRGFDDVLKEAQELGFAEADPSFDIDGVDAAHKLTILASLAFGTELDFDNVAVTGIRHVLAEDIAEAAALGYRIRLVGMAENGPEGLFQRVHPMLVPLDHPLAHVDGSLNAVVAEGNCIGGSRGPDRCRARRIWRCLCDARRGAGATAASRCRSPRRPRLSPFQGAGPSRRSGGDRGGDPRRRRFHRKHDSTWREPR
jgi:homoserine dehydrogenase